MLAYEDLLTVSLVFHCFQVMRIGVLFVACSEFSGWRGRDALWEVFNFGRRQVAEI
jgi:hypothetical protein